MRFFFHILYTTNVFVHAVRSEPKREITQPEDAALVLKESFEKLTDVFSARRPPTSREDFVEDSSHVLASFCDENDTDCVETASDQLLAELRDAESGPEEELVYSDDFDPQLMRLVERVESTLQGFRSLDDFDAVVDDVLSARKEIELADDVDVADKEAALIAVEIALESVRAWHGAYSDPDHPLHGVVRRSSARHDRDDEKRNLLLRRDSDEDDVEFVDVAAMASSNFRAGFNRATASGDRVRALTPLIVARSFLARSMSLCETSHGDHGSTTSHTHGSDGSITTTTSGHTHNADGSITTTTTTETVSHHVHGPGHHHGHHHGYYYGYGYYYGK